MMRKRVVSCAIVLLAAGIGPIGCVYTIRHMTLSYPLAVVRSEARESGRPQILLSRFADGRPTGNVVGEVYTSRTTANPVWQLDNDLGEFLKEALAAELGEAGVAVAPGGAGEAGDSIRVEGKVNVFYGWAASSDAFFTAAVNIDVSLLAKNRPVFVQSYVSQKTTAKINPDCQAILGAATSEVMKRAAGDIRNFLYKESSYEKK